MCVCLCVCRERGQPGMLSDASCRHYIGLGRLPFAAGPLRRHLLHWMVLVEQHPLRPDGRFGSSQREIAEFWEEFQSLLVFLTRAGSNPKRTQGTKPPFLDCAQKSLREVKTGGEWEWNSAWKTSLIKVRVKDIVKDNVRWRLIKRVIYDHLAISRAKVLDSV